MATGLTSLRTAEDLLREVLAAPDDAEKLLSRWMIQAWRSGYLSGLEEALRRDSEPVQRTTLAEVMQGAHAAH